MRKPLSVTIITFNEEKNIARALKSVAWAEERIVVDSGSLDRTVEIAKSLGAKVIQNPFAGYGQQKNFAAAQAQHEWILNLDADEEVPPSLRAEIEAVLSGTPDRMTVFAIARKTFYGDAWVRYGGWYPNYVGRLSHKEYTAWSEPEIHESLQGTGPGVAPVFRLQNPMYHYTFSGIQDQVRTNLKYAAIGAKELERRGKRSSRTLVVLKALSKFIESYFLKRGFMDGWIGFVIAINAAHSAFLKYALRLESQK